MELTKNDILQAINNSGYLFEQEIATLIENKGFHVQTNVAFADEDEDKSREIDVVAYKNCYHNEQTKISISVKILCECKNSTNPFVFIYRKKNEVDSRYNPPCFTFPKKEYHEPVPDKQGSYWIKSGFSFFNIDSIFPYSLEDTKAVQFCKLVIKDKKWNAFHDGIYDSIIFPMVKCLESYKNQDSKYNNGVWKHYIVYFPIVILSSDLYAINSEKLKSVDQIKCVDYVHFTRDINNTKIKDKYLIDFITKDGLDSYIQVNINQFMEKFVEKLKVSE